MMMMMMMMIIIMQKYTRNSTKAPDNSGEANYMNVCNIYIYNII